MLALLALLAHAADEAPSVQHVNYLVGRGAHVEASAEAGALLTANPDDLAAHFAYVSARSRGHGGDQLVPMYRAWLEAEPDRVGARFGLAAALARGTRDAGPCAELTGLLEPLPEDAVTRFWSVRVRSNVAKPCGWDGDALKDELIALGAEVPVARRHALHLRISAGLDDALVADLRAAYAEDPESLGIAWMLWSEDRKGPLVGKARKDALAAAERIEADSDDPRALHYAAAALRAAGEGDRAAALAAEVAKLDPLGGTEVDAPTPLQRELFDANRKPTHELALASLDAIATQVPASGPARATWHALRADRLEALGRDDEAYAAVRDAALADPTSARRGNTFAWEAAVRGEDLDAALAAIERSLAWLYAQSWDPKGQEGWDDWAEDHRSSLAGWEDTRGWVLHRMGRDEEARVALERAVLFASVPDLHAHLGVVLEALGEHAAAFEQLALASEGGEPLSEEVAAPAREALARLWPTAGIWHPGGLEGWLAARAEVEDEDDDDDDDEPAERAPHPLLGQTFPIDRVTRLAGGETSLAGVKGVKVVDLWATWCGPCVAGMPHLKQVAAAYEDRGVTVVGLSVDQQIAPVKRFFQGAGDLGYDIAWIGQPGYDLAKVNGIPALFVVDADGKVFEFIQGYGEGDKRLETALDKLLAR